MVSGLAPIISSMGRWKGRNTAMTAAEMRRISSVQLPRISSARSVRPSPVRMAAREPPPMPTRADRAEMNMMMAKATPTPVMARSPSGFMWPRYIRSTMLYRALTTWAVTAGRASRSSSWGTGSLPRSLVRFATVITPPHFPGNKLLPCRRWPGRRPGGTAGGPGPRCGGPRCPRSPCASGWPWPPHGSGGGSR